jgi:hypothetical protein
VETEPETTPAASTADICRYVAPRSGEQSDLRQYKLAYCWLGGYFSLIWAYVALIGYGVSQEAVAAMREILSLLTPATLMVLGYFYTASIGGRRKDEALVSVMRGQSDA